MDRGENTIRSTLIILIRLFSTAAGDPVPSVGVSLEQIHGGVYHTQRDCTKNGGSIIHKNGKTYCNSAIKKRDHGRAKLTVSDEGRHKRIVASTETGQDGDYKLAKNKNEEKHKGLSLERIPRKYLSYTE